MSNITAEELAVFFTDRCETVLVTNDFQTDIGTRVYRGRRQVLPENVPCTVIVEGDDRPIDSDTKREGWDQKVLLNQHYLVEGFAFCESENHPNDTCHKIIRDLKRVIFKRDPELYSRIKGLLYSGRLIGVRNDGTNIISAYVEFDVRFVENLAEA